MGKLHELLAVQDSLKAEGRNTLKAALGLFTSGQGRLTGQVQRYEPFEEEYSESAQVQVMEITVNQVLDNIAQVFGQYVDAGIQKEETNALTSAYIMIDGQPVFDEPLSAPALLNIEGRLRELKAVYEAIPVNNVTYNWEYDKQLDCFVSGEQRRIRTRKERHHETVFEGNENHPPQVDIYTKDKPIGYVFTSHQSGALTSADRKEKLARLEVLIRAVRKACKRANQADVKSVHVANKLLAFINTGVV